jgi:uncharacterized membrane protein YgcG
MTLRTQATITLVASVGLCAPFAVVLAQDDADSSSGLETPPPEATAEATQDEDVRGFWGWVEENITIEYPDGQSPDDGRSGDGRGGGGDSGGGGGHGG